MVEIIPLKKMYVNKSNWRDFEKLEIEVVAKEINVLQA